MKKENLERVEESAAPPKPCKFVGTNRVYYWGNGLVDPSEPEFVAGKGIPLPAEDLPCRTVADEGEDYCPRHKMEIELRELGNAG